MLLQLMLPAMSSKIYVFITFHKIEKYNKKWKPIEQHLL